MIENILNYLPSVDSIIHVFKAVLIPLISALGGIALTGLSVVGVGCAFVIAYHLLISITKRIVKKLSKL